MKKTAIIALDRPGRLLKKTQAYLSDINTFLAETTDAIMTLLDTLPYADPPLMEKILPLLGLAGNDRVLWPLFHLMMDSSIDDAIRRLAAVQLGLAASLSKELSELDADLIKSLDHPEALVRGGCALALGREGNGWAVPALMSHLKDPDQDVQAAVVAALSSVNDDRTFELLTQRLENGHLEEQRSIVLNLWRFAEQIPRVQKVYLDCLNWLPAELYPDILTGVSMIPHNAAVLSLYHRMLSEDNPHIRLQALENLEALDPTDYQALHDRLYQLLADEEYRIRQVATRLLAKC